MTTEAPWMEGKRPGGRDRVSEMTNTAEYLTRMRRVRRGANPLVRRTDRVESRVFTLFVAVLLLLVPLSIWASVVTWGNQTTLAEQQQAERATVTATLDTDPALDAAGWGDMTYATAMTAPATWKWQGIERHGVVQADDSAVAGDEVQVWVDRAGEQSLPPMSDGAARFAGVLAGVSLFAFAGVFATGAFVFARWRIDRARTDRWSREIEAFLGSTSSH